MCMYEFPDIKLIYFAVLFKVQTNTNQYIYSITYVGVSLNAVQIFDHSFKLI